MFDENIEWIWDGHGPKYEAWCELSFDIGNRDYQDEWEMAHNSGERIEDIKTMVRFLMESHEGWEKISKQMYAYYET